MTDQELFRLYQFLRKPIYWDPPPPWLQLTEAQMSKFNEVQVRMNAKIAQIEHEKVVELGKIAGLSMK